MVYHRRLGVLGGHICSESCSGAAGSEELQPPPSSEAPAAAAPTVGVLLKNAEKAFPGLTMFHPGRSTVLIDLNGELVHEWNSNRGGSVGYLQPDGTLIRYGQSPRFTGPGNPRDETEWNTKHWSFAGGAGYVQALHWDSTLLWEYQYIGHRVCGHHDIEVMPNGHVLISAWERHTREEAIAKGRDPEKLTDDELWSDHVVEVAPDGNGGGKIVWRWDWWDHLVQDFDADKPDYVTNVNEAQRRLDINATPRSTGDDWIHTNSIAYNAELDQILLSSNFLSEVYIIDHSITSEEAATCRGDLLWRWGNPRNYGAESPQKLFGQHNAHWIPAGCPGAGNILLFNNGGALGPDVPNPGSSVDEIVLPPMVTMPSSSSISSHMVYELAGPPSSQRRAVGEPVKGTFGPVESTWRFSADGFYGSYISGVQRLPNGNTLINHGPHGCFFEVSLSGEVVWCYLNPCVGSADDSNDLKVVPQWSIISEYDAHAGDDEDAGQEQPAEPDSEPDEQPLTAVRSLQQAIEIEKERHSESLRQLKAAIEDVHAAADPQQPAGPASEQRLPFCDSSSKKFSWANSTFRAERISFSHPALQEPGRDLTPKGCLESVGASLA
jgi:hypothetical protein